MRGPGPRLCLFPGEVDHVWCRQIAENLAENVGMSLITQEPRFSGMYNVSDLAPVFME